MTLTDFDKFLCREMKACKDLMMIKNADYATDDDKLANFKLAGKIDGIGARFALYGMDLKHRASINQGLEDTAYTKEHTLSWWQEKIRDHINYMFLLLALIEEGTE